MTDKKRKAPKIAWRDLKKGGAESPAAPEPSASPEQSGTPEIVASPELTGTWGAPPDINMPPEPPSSVTVPAPVEASAPRAAPVPPVATPAATPAARAPSAPATPEDEVHRILGKLARHVPAARPDRAPRADVEGDTADDATTAPLRHGPTYTREEDVAPFVAPSELREATRARRGRAELLLFRAGGEVFALPLGVVEEAIETPAINPLPEMPAAMLGVFRLRERLVPTYSPGSALGVAVGLPAGAALLVRSGERRIALAADDVEDVMELDLATLREPPVLDDGDAILLGVARFGRELVGVLDADALIAACLGGRTVEIS